MTDQMRQQINDLIVGISKGNEFALDELSRLVSARMLSIALSIVHNRTVAEEVVQDSFLRIVYNANLFKPNTNGYGWICKITQNVALTALRRENRHRADNIDDWWNIAADDDVFETSSTRVLLKQAMSALTEYEQQVIYQKYFMDFTVRAIAKSLGKSRSSVQRAITSAEEKLQKFINSGTKP